MERGNWSQSEIDELMKHVGSSGLRISKALRKRLAKLANTSEDELDKILGSIGETDGFGRPIIGPGL